MKVMHVLDAWLYGEEGVLPGGEAFEEKYAAFRAGPITRFVFSNEHMLAEALAYLGRYKLESQHFYQFRLIPEEVAAYPAIYFGIVVADEVIIERIVDPVRMGEAEVVMDYESEQIVFSDRAQRIVQNMTAGVWWETLRARDGTTWATLKHVGSLPEPIIIPAPVEVNLNEAPPGTFAVRSDGRDIVTEANIIRLDEVGLAVSNEAMVPSGVIQWRSRYIASGKIIGALKTAGVSGLLEPLTPLLPETHLLS